ncbi:thiamine ABC transporter substrate binding subunit [[Haemophilus] ducreyi]|uniref:thiamine ABC transporter substrate binding subunit n=1 Tax=Haemophilus ducreyi TaxID=730 RepID=UPI000654DFF5|nr:thiamine ABC transporter substrate binding subunit [[Haemophilus] ducreyi]AKO45088.1 thiamine ABC transporter substrate-binding protein [[Haemophilus] ducreyi]AKO46490.1 thiamine ABC transporter substrate-binding protein [[Haemophilus] ducreyi]AKO47832.1 thiamine ABC transporter substrate-binding protein [[Haemophilus] ducreyi]AKO49219.1 thiamine ABC transporter substrate-binding protein [[Haemophilus] ducreyi]ANF62269.1 thiamine ABC transporter substrate-binding protein [[Haemophilus] ducr
MKFTKLIAFSAVIFSGSLFAQKPLLTVYTYDSFASDWGAAPKLEEKFEKVCDCDVKFIPFEDGITMLNRIRLEGKKTKADIMLGIDNFTMPEAVKSGLFAVHNLSIDQIKWQDNTFFPYDYSEYAFIYNKEKITNPPKSLKELVERQDLKVIYQDPRTSTVGRGLLFWLNTVYAGNAEQAWKTLAKHTVTVGKGWSETYGAFLKGESDLVLSYTTSPLYHYWHEQTDKYVAAEFEEGHLVQTEVAAILKTSKQPALAKAFLTFLHHPEAQKIIAYHNVMKPVITTEVDPAFVRLPTYKTLAFEQPESNVVKQWIATWAKSWN